MNLKKIFRILACSFLLLLLLENVMVFAAWIKIEKAAVSTSLSGTYSVETLSVGTETELHQNAADSLWSSGSAVSAVGDRKILTLTADITLSSDLLVTADMDWDLGGYTLNLGGHTLTIRHDYAGIFYMENGTVSNGTLQIETPNATVDLNGATITAATNSVAKGATQEELANHLFNKVENILLHGDSGGYFYDDLPLPLYFSYDDVEVNYTSSAPAVVDATGKIGTVSTSTAVTMTLTLTFPDGATKSRAYTVHIIPKTEAAQWCAVASDQLFWDNRFAQYLNADGDYEVSNQVFLPIYNQYISDAVLYSYQVYDCDETHNKTATELSGYLVTAPTGDGMCLNSMGNKWIWLECTATIGGSFDTSGRAIHINSRSDSAVVAREIFDDIYEGGERTIGGNATIGYDYSQSGLISDLSHKLSSGISIADRGVTRIDYQLYDGDDIYEIVTDAAGMRVQVRSGAEPNALDVGIVKATVHFGENTKADMYLRVIYFDATADMDFTPYYQYLNNLLVTSRTQYLTAYQSFGLPSLMGKTPYINYSLTRVDKDGNALDGGGDLSAIQYSGRTLISVENTAPPSGAAKPTGAATFTINTENLPDEDVYVRINYQYRFGTDWKPYDKSTTIRLPAVVHDASSTLNNKIADSDIFDAAYALCGGITYGDTRKFIFRSDIENLSGDFSVSGKTIESLSGIRYLAGVKNLNLSSCGITDAVLSSSLSEFDSLQQMESINLSGNALTVWSSDACWLGELPSLQKIDISSNQIQQFYQLDKYSEGFRIAIGGQNTGESGILLDWFGIRFYGENGILNRGIIASATAHRVTVEGVSSSGGTDNIMVTGNLLQDMVYQNKTITGAGLQGSDIMSSIYYSSPQTHQFLKDMVPGKNTTYTPNTNFGNSSIDVILNYNVTFGSSGTVNIFSKPFSYTMADQTNLTDSPVRPGSYYTAQATPAAEEVPAEDTTPTTDEVPANDAEATTPPATDSSDIVP